MRNFKTGMIPRFETERLLLRPFNLSDAAEVKRLAGEFEIADTTLSIPHPYEDGMAEQWIGTHGKNFTAGQAVTFAVTERSAGRLAGAMSLIRIESGHQAELGYWIGKPFWNRGFCSEAAKEVVKYAFSNLGVIRLYANHLSRNPASGRVLRKLGFLHEGSRRQHIKKWDKFEDDELYGLLKTDWLKQGASA
ncbi:MAG TPA: GNAT family N-acetyltransferase [Gammaproteobacteria bacterium]|nr:GNAT family N-acetyltransferase [Gammaproteobacteria bacterium]